MYLADKLKRTQFWAVAAALVLALLLPIFAVSKASAYTLVTSRSIQMSSSATSATNVLYKVSFTTAAAYTVGSVEIQFCTDPFIGASCTAPTGLDVNEGTITVNNQSGITGLSVHANTTTNRLVLTRTAGAIGSGTAVSFELGNGSTTGITNPSTLGSFYARIGTFSATDGTGTQQDAGGVALSTANQLTVTAKVQETLTFCVYTTGSDCSGGTGTSLALGDSNGVLASSTTYYTGTAKFGLASNASSGVIVRLKGDTLKTGSFSITSQGATCTADSTTSTVEQFGLRLSAVGSGQSATAPYNCGSGLHALDIATACTSANEENVTCTYGDRLASTSAPNDESQSTMEFGAKAASSTEAGIYTATFTFIATGTY